MNLAPGIIRTEGLHRWGNGPEGRPLGGPPTRSSAHERIARHLPARRGVLWDHGGALGAGPGGGLLLAVVLGAAGRGVRAGPASGPRAERGGALGARLALLRLTGSLRAGKCRPVAACLGAPPKRGGLGARSPDVSGGLMVQPLA